MKSACEFSKKGAEIPSLLNATSEELVSGLSDSRFTSVDLVVVCLSQLLVGSLVLILVLGIFKAHRRCEQCTECSHGN